MSVTASPIQSSPVSLVERVFVVASILLFARALIPLLRTGAGNNVTPSAAGDAGMRLVFIAVYAITGLFVLIHLQSFIHSMLRDKWLLAASLLPIVSTFWATNSSITLRRGAAFMLTTMFGLYVASRFSLREQLRLLAVAMTISLAASLIFVLFFPEYGIMSGYLTGSWRGIYTQKNDLGRMLDLSIIAFILLALAHGRRIGLAWIGVATALVVLPLTHSSGALVVAVALISLLPLVRIVQRSNTLAAPMLIALILAGAALGFVAFGDSTPLVGALGETQSWAGRTSLWSFLFGMIRRHPFLGYGYGSFWLGWNGPSAEVWSAFPWMPGLAHNGLIDLWLDLGLLGVGLMTASVVTAYRRAIKLMRADQGWESTLPFLLISWVLLVDVVGSGLLIQNGLFWVLYVVSVNSVAAQTQTQVEPAVAPAREPTPAVVPRPARARAMVLDRRM